MGSQNNQGKLNKLNYIKYICKDFENIRIDICSFIWGMTEIRISWL